MSIDRPLMWRNSSTYDWMTKCINPPLRKMNSSDFCFLLGGRHLVLLGDSLTAHWAYLLQLTLSNSARTRDGTSGYSRFVVVGVPICTDTVRPARVSLLKYWRLTIEDVAGWEPGLATFFQMLRHVSNTSIIAVVNRGAHYTPDDEFINEVRHTLGFVTNQSDVSTVVWRNTPPGHVNCTSYNGPMVSPQSESGLPYNWGHFREQNLLVEALLQAEFPSVWHLDVYSSTVLRPDGHAGAKDCLHYQTTASVPLLHWTRLLYNMLAEAAELGLHELSR